MKAELITKTLVSLIGAMILLLSVKAMAFLPSQPAVAQCINAVEQKYQIRQQDLGLLAVRARPIGDKAAVIYLHSATNPSTAQQRMRLYCTVDQNGGVTQLRANPRLLEVGK